MREYQIEYTHDEMGDMKFRAYKWAGDEKKAVRLLLRVNAGRDGRVQFKNGGTGRILSVTDITGGDGSFRPRELRFAGDAGSTPATSTN